MQMCSFGGGCGGEGEGECVACVFERLCRLGEMGCRAAGGGAVRAGIIESKLPGSAKQSDVPEACPARRSSL